MRRSEERLWAQTTGGWQLVVPSVMMGGGGGWVEAGDGATGLVWRPTLSSARHTGAPSESTPMRSAAAAKII